MGNVWRAEEAWLVFGGGGQVPFWEKLIFCAGDLSGGGGQSIASVLYLIFLTNIVGLNPGWAGTVLMLSKMWDAVSAPLMGVISDNTRSPHGPPAALYPGRRHPPPARHGADGYPAGFEGQAAKVAYMTAVYVFYSTVSTVVSVLYCSARGSPRTSPCGAG